MKRIGERPLLASQLAASLVAALALSGCTSTTPSEKCLTFPVNIGADRNEAGNNVRSAANYVLRQYLGVARTSLQDGSFSGVGDVMTENVRTISAQRPNRSSVYPTDIIGMMVTLNNPGDPSNGGVVVPWTRHTKAIDMIDSPQLQQGVKLYDCTDGSIRADDFARLK